MPSICVGTSRVCRRLFANAGSLARSSTSKPVSTGLGRTLLMSEFHLFVSCPHNIEVLACSADLILFVGDAAAGRVRMGTSSSS